jgi:hypothetical protein
VGEAIASLRGEEFEQRVFAAGGVGAAVRHRRAGLHAPIRRARMRRSPSRCSPPA